MGKTNSGKKKKGPKGKKARAKAKLERQWGEIEKQKGGNPPYSRGKLSILSKGHRSTASPTVSFREENLTCSHDVATHSILENELSSDESEEHAETEPAITLLLRTIKPATSAKPNHFFPTNRDDMEDDDNDDENSETMMNDAEDAKEEEEASDESPEVDDRVLEDEDTVETVQQNNDPFSAHFKKEPFDEDPVKRQKTMAPATILKKVKPSVLNESMDLQVAQPLVDELKLLANNGFAYACASLFPFNHKLLKTYWAKVNRRSLKSANKLSGRAAVNGDLSSLQVSLYPSLAGYSDLLISCATREIMEELDNILALHSLNHIMTSRSRIQRNNRRIQEAVDIVGGDRCRDQGFTRPTVLILLPTRATCHAFIHKMKCLLGGDSYHMENMDRFEVDYGPPSTPGDRSDANNGDGVNTGRRRLVQLSKGDEWNELFGDEVNSDDDFKIGLSITTKATGTKIKSDRQNHVACRLYTDFYRSDMILASPLALKMVMEENEDTDFLSSIEVCSVLRSDVLLMQNWDHVNSVLEALNQQPKKNNDADFSRVRNYYLVGQAQHWRQLIISSGFADPNLQSTFKRFATSRVGATKLCQRLSNADAALNRVTIKARQVFQRIKCPSFSQQGNDRLKYLKESLLDKIRNRKHTMIFVPSYFEFISLRNFLLEREIEFVSVTEYARVSEVSRGRARFLQGRKPLMLYTGRAHYFSRHLIKGVRHLVFYGLPEHAEFYPGLLNVLNQGLLMEGEAVAGSGCSCLALFTKYEGHALERIVGKENCHRMLKRDKPTFLFL